MNYTGNHMVDADDGKHPFSPYYMGEGDEQQFFICDECGCETTNKELLCNRCESKLFKLSIQHNNQK